MSVAADLLVDRRRLRRQVSLWRVLAIGVALISVIGAGFAFFGRSLGGSAQHIARVRIDGLITGKQETLDLLARAERSQAKALILRINSGGGTTSGSEALFLAVKRVAAKKPVIAVIDGVGASGAYMTAIGAERILANGSAVVGSIGVIAQYPNLVKLLDTLGIKVEAVRSSPLKAMPSGIEVTPPEARAALEETVQESYRWFRALVGERRNLEGAALNTVADGRVFTGRQALELKLIDALGGEHEAVSWLETEKSLPKNLRIVEYKPAETFRGLAGLSAMKAVADLLGMQVQPEIAETVRQVLGPNALDGLVSLWHPSRD